MRGQPFVYQEETGSWSVGVEMWRGGSWASNYYRLAKDLPGQAEAENEAKHWRYSFPKRQFVREESCK